MGRMRMRNPPELLVEFERCINLENVALPRIIDNWLNKI